MQSPLRPGSQMVPGTPEGQSPNHASPGHPFPGPQESYHRMPPRSTDPYSMLPPTPRPASSGELNSPQMQQRVPPPGHDVFAQSPTGQKTGPGDPYNQPPSTPHPEHGVPGRGPEFSPSPGVAHASDPFAQGPGMLKPHTGIGPRPPLQHQTSWHDSDGPDRPPSVSYAPGMPRLPGPPGVGMPPRMPRQLSEPGIPVGASSAEEYPFSTSDQFGVSRSDSVMASTGDPYSHPPGTPLPHMGDRFPRPRMPIRQHSVPVDGQFRPPLRHPHLRPGMMMDPYSQQPGTPRPRMEHVMPYHVSTVFLRWLL